MTDADELARRRRGILCLLLVATTYLSSPQQVVALPEIAVSEPDNDAVLILSPPLYAATTRLAVGTAPRPLVRSEDGTTLVVGNAGSVSIVDIRSRSVSGTITGTPNTPWAMTLDAHGQLFVLDLLASVTTVVDVESRSVVAEIPSGRGPVAAALADNGDLLVVNLEDENVVFIDTQTLRIKRRVRVGRSPVRISVAGDRALVANAGDGTFTILSVESGETIRTTPVELALLPPFLNSTAVLGIFPTRSPDAAIVAQTIDYGDQSVFGLVVADSVTGCLRRATPNGELTPPGRPIDLALTSDRARIVVAADGAGFSAPGILSIFDASSLKEERRIALDQRPGGVAITSEGSSGASHGCQIDPAGSKIPIAWLPVLLWVGWGRGWRIGRAHGRAECLADRPNRNLEPRFLAAGLPIRRDE